MAQVRWITPKNTLAMLGVGRVLEVSVVKMK